MSLETSPLRRPRHRSVFVLVAALSAALLAAVLMTNPASAKDDDHRPHARHGTHGTDPDGGDGPRWRASKELIEAPVLARRADTDNGAPPDFPKLPKRCYQPPEVNIPKPDACFITKFKGKRPTLVIWGDSHMIQYIPAVKAAVRGQNVNLVSFVSGSCPPVWVAKERPRMAGCKHTNVNGLQFLRRQKAKGHRLRVIVSSNFSGYRRAYRQIFVQNRPEGFKPYTIEMVKLYHARTNGWFGAIGRLKIPTDVVAQSPTYPDVHLPCPYGNEPYQCDLRKARAFPGLKDTRTWLKGQMKKLVGKPRYINPSPTYCQGAICHGLIGNVRTYFDHLHLSGTRTATMGKYFLPSVKALKKQPKP